MVNKEVGIEMGCEHSEMDKVMLDVDGPPKLGKRKPDGSADIEPSTTKARIPGRRCRACGWEVPTNTGGGEETTPYYSDSEAPPFDRVRAWLEDHRRGSITISDIGLRINVVLRGDRGSVDVVAHDAHDAIDIALRWWWDATRRDVDPNVLWSVDTDALAEHYHDMCDRLRKAVPDGA